MRALLLLAVVAEAVPRYTAPWDVPECEKSMQSPIELPAIDKSTPKGSLLKHWDFAGLNNLKGAELKWTSSGKGLEATGDFGTASFQGNPFTVTSLEFYMPGMHPIAGKRFDGEMHIMMQSELEVDGENDLAVIAVPLQIGTGMSFLNDIGFSRGIGGGATTVGGRHRTLKDEFSHHLGGHFHHYKGMDTSSESLNGLCKNEVSWLVLVEPVLVDEAHVRSFKAAFGGGNNRLPVAPSEGRLVLHDLHNAARHANSLAWPSEAHGHDQPSDPQTNPAAVGRICGVGIADCVGGSHCEPVSPLNPSALSICQKDLMGVHHACGFVAGMDGPPLSCREGLFCQADNPLLSTTGPRTCVVPDAEKAAGKTVTWREVEEVLAYAWSPFHHGEAVAFGRAAEFGTLLKVTAYNAGFGKIGVRLAYTGMLQPKPSPAGHASLTTQLAAALAVSADRVSVVSIVKRVSARKAAPLAHLTNDYVAGLNVDIVTVEIAPPIGRAGGQTCGNVWGKGNVGDCRAGFECTCTGECAAKKRTGGTVPWRCAKQDPCVAGDATALTAAGASATLGSARLGSAALGGLGAAPEVLEQPGGSLAVRLQFPRAKRPVGDGAKAKLVAAIADALSICSERVSITAVLSRRADSLGYNAPGKRSGGGSKSQFGVLIIVKIDPPRKYGGAVAQAAECAAPQATYKALASKHAACKPAKAAPAAACGAWGKGKCSGGRMSYVGASSSKADCLAACAAAGGKCCRYRQGLGKCLSSAGAAGSGSYDVATPCGGGY